MHGLFLFIYVVCNFGKSWSRFYKAGHRELMLMVLIDLFLFKAVNNESDQWHSLLISYIVLPLLKNYVYQAALDITN